MAWMDGDGQWMEEVAIFRTADRSQRQIYFYFGFLQQMTLFYSLVDFKKYVIWLNIFLQFVEASLLDRNKMTKNRLEFDRTKMTTTNLNFGT